MLHNVIEEIQQLNPWLTHDNTPIFVQDDYIQRKLTEPLLSPNWDPLCTVLIGPRQAGKTTLGKYLSHVQVQEKRFDQLIYLNCDYDGIRGWLKTPLFIDELLKHFPVKNPIIFIDEVQRLESPGLLIKAVYDLKKPIKIMVSGSSQLEIKSKVKEHLTGRQITATVLPLALNECQIETPTEDMLIYGKYPQIIQTEAKQLLLAELFNQYIQKDVIEILKISDPDVMRRLITLIAHSSGQLVNIQQLCADCNASYSKITHYLSILENTFILQKITPFVGNKRTEITSNPIYYFVDNGMRNQALRNFSAISSRTDIGFLIENYILQELLKFEHNSLSDIDIHFWRTKGGSEVDFILKKSETELIPIEVKYQNLSQPKISRGFRSFIEAYQPKQAIIVTKSLIAEKNILGCTVSFVSFKKLSMLFKIIS